MQENKERDYGGERTTCWNLGLASSNKSARGDKRTKTKEVRQNQKQVRKGRLQGSS